MSLMNITLVEGLPFKVPEIEYIGDTLPWHPSLKWDQRDPSTIRRLIVHHMASDAPLVNQAKYHINTHGWPGLSYTLAVSDGRLKLINDPCSITYHASGNNEDSVCIAIHGDLSKRELRSDERELLYAGILTLKSIFPIESVLGHNEVNPTACPCISMNKVREDIMRIEKQMEYAKSRNGQEAMAYNIAQTILWTYNTAKGLDQYGKPTVTEEGKEWARQRLLLLEPAMREHGFLQ